VRIRWDAGRLRLELLSRKRTLWLFWTGSQGGGGWGQHRRPTIAPPSYHHHTTIVPPSYHDHTTIVLPSQGWLRRDGRWKRPESGRLSGLVAFADSSAVACTLRVSRERAACPPSAVLLRRTGWRFGWGRAFDSGSKLRAFQTLRVAAQEILLKVRDFQVLDCTATSAKPRTACHRSGQRHPILVPSLRHYAAGPCRRLAAKKE